MLHILIQLPILRAEPSSVALVEAAQPLLSALLDSLLVETDLDILTGSLLFLSHVTRSPSFVVSKVTEIVNGFKMFFYCHH